MDAKYIPKKRWFQPSIDVRYDTPQEVRDVAAYGILLPFPTMSGLRTLALATSTRIEYPVVVNYSANQVEGIIEELKVAAHQPEVVPDRDQAVRLEVIAEILGNAVTAPIELTQ